MLDRNFFSFLTISWISPLIRKGSRTPLQYEDLDEIPDKFRASSMAHVLDPTWEKFRKLCAKTSMAQMRRGSRTAPIKNKNISFLGPIIYSQLSHIMGALFFNTLNLACIIGTPIVIGKLIKHIIDPPDHTREPVPMGYRLVGILFALQIVSALANNAAAQIASDIGLNLNTIIVRSVYQKSMRISHSAQKEFSRGRILSLVNVDARCFASSVGYMIEVVFVFLQIAASMYLLYTLLGLAGLTSMGMLAIMMIGSSIATRVYSKQLKQYLAAGDERIKLLREMLYGIKAIKFRSLETYFSNRINAIRSVQIKHLKQANVSLITFISMEQTAPITMCVVGIFTSLMTKGRISPERLFPALTLFMELMEPLMSVAKTMQASALAIASWKRISKFLNADEIIEVQNKGKGKAKDSSSAVKLDGSSFIWDGDAEASTRASITKISEQSKALQTEDHFNLKRQARVMASHEVDEDETVANVEFTDGKPKETSVETVTKMSGRRGTEVGIDKSKGRFRLTNINLDIPRGKLVAIVGSVGSGKSSLLSALCGEMVRTGGTMQLNGSVAYCAQEPWIMTETVRENILFGNDVDEKRLDTVVRAVGLRKEIKAMSLGMNTYIGERGINLSGGQRARVALARALYMDTDIVMLDEPLASLDSHIGGNVFQKAIKEQMKGKTVLMVTNRLQVLQHVDNIIVMQTGRVVEQGTFVQLMSKQNGALMSMVSNKEFDDIPFFEGSDADAYMSPTTISTKVDGTGALGGAIYQQEDRVIGHVSPKTYAGYLRVVKNPCFIFLAVVILVMTVGSMTVTNIILSILEPKINNGDYKWYLKAYAAIGGMQVVSSVLLNILIIYATQLAAVYLHKGAFSSLMRAPLDFFDSHPSGRILNRMSGDVEMIDLNLSVISFMFVYSLCVFMSSTLVLAYTSYYTVGLIVAVFALNVFLFERYQRSTRELRRIVSIERSPLLAHISETLSGMPTIRACDQGDRFLLRQLDLMDRTNKPLYYYGKAEIWIRMRIALTSSTIIFLIGVLGVSGYINATMAGLALTYAATIASATSLLAASADNLEAEFNTVERIDHYVRGLPVEKVAKKPTDPGVGAWPSEGKVNISGLEVKYPNRKSHPAVTGVTVDIHAGEKIAVVGRTGSGKSTLMSSLFRIVEPSSGSIVIDGVDVSTLGLATLRSRLQIIPQEPVLFSGTVRSNLCFDPTDDDSALWDVLDRVGMRDHVSSMPGKLDAVIEEGGENLSVGQRQLICLARAILTNPKVILFDEATTAVDTDVRNIIVKSIKTQFAKTTVLNIAHRLNSVVEFDRVMVMDDGHVAEFDTPCVLLSAFESKLSQLVDATGAVNAQKLRQDLGILPTGQPDETSSDVDSDNESNNLPIDIDQA